MKLFQSNEIKKLDAYTIQNEPITSTNLMERSAIALRDAIKQQWGTEHTFIVFAGPGNNGGDALALSRLLAEAGYTVQTYLFNTTGKLSDDCEINKSRLANTNVTFHEITSAFTPPNLNKEDIVIDGLFGSGLNKPLTGGFAAVIRYINASPSTVVSIDIPSGLMSEDNTYTPSNSVIRASYTFTLQIPKLAFFFAENEDYLGEWQVLDIHLHPEGIASLQSNYWLTDANDIKKLIKPRKRFAHKGNFGHGLLIAGSKGMAGSSILAARSCLRSGIGLLTVHAPFCNNTILQTAVPEAIVENDLLENCFALDTDTDNYQAIAIGPGLGTSEETTQAVISQLNGCSIPLVLDADALNIIAQNHSILNSIPKGSILTPHPKEFDRLTGQSQNSFERLNKARDLATSLQSYIVLKGAFTTIVSPEGDCYFNPTGNPGMATAGSGDVLTGILLSLLAQNYKPLDACLLGVYLHGKAGDLAAQKKGIISLLASDIVDELPHAWIDLSSILVDDKK